MSLIAIACGGGGGDTAGSATDVHTASIAGVLQDSAGTYLETTKVYLYSEGSLARQSGFAAVAAEGEQREPYDSVFTDSGRFVFDSLPAGAWSVEAVQEGVRIGVAEGIGLAAGEHRELVIQVTVVIYQSFYITVDNSSTVIQNIYLPGGSAAWDGDSLALGWTESSSDTLWIEVQSGDSTALVPALLSRNSDGSLHLQLLDSDSSGLGFEPAEAPSSSSAYSSSSTPSSSSSSITSSSTISSSSSVSSSSSHTVTSSSSTLSDACSVQTDGGRGAFRDERDSREYACTVYGRQTWMAENLSYEGSAAFQSWCFQDQDGYCAWGRLYDYASAASDSLCPLGWHLPTYAEWRELADSVTSRFDLAGQSNGVWAEVAGVLKADSSLWGFGRGSDGIGFAALPAGKRETDGFWNAGDLGSLAAFWTASGITWDSAFAVQLVQESLDLSAVTASRETGFSVRCVED